MLRCPFHPVSRLSRERLILWPDECKQVLSAVAAYSAGTVKVDADGNATFPAVAAGTYYVYGAVQYNKQPLLYDLRIDLRSGTNSVTLGERNATPVN